jgi:hypothetical protein
MRQVKCPDCRALLKVRDESRGMVRCPQCGAAVGLDAGIPVVGGPDDSPRVPRPALKHSLRETAGAAPAPAVPVVTPMESRPRRERPENVRSGGAGTLLIVLGVVGLLFVLMCAGGGIIAYLLWDSGSSSSANVASTAPKIGSADPAPPIFNPPPRRGPEGVPPDFQRQMDDAMRRMDGMFGGGEPPKPVKLPVLPAAVPIGVAPLPSDTLAIDLPDRVARAASGGGGRFMVLSFGNEKKVGVFDLNDLKTSYVDVPEPEAWVAAGMNRFVVFLPRAKKLRRYNLLDRKLEKERDFDPPQELCSFCMGSASAGPLLVVAGPNLSREPRFYDLDTLEPMKIPAVDGFPAMMLSSPADTYFAAANGRAFGSHWGIDSNMALSSLSIADGLARRFAMTTHTNFVAPFADGKHVCTGGRGVLTIDLKGVPGAVYSRDDFGIFLTYLFVPAQAGPYYMHVQTGGIAAGADDGLPNTAGTIVFYALGNKQPLLTLRNVPAPSGNELDGYKSIGLPRGIHFSPQAKALVVVPPARDKLHLYRVELAKK